MEKKDLEEAKENSLNKQNSYLYNSCKTKQITYFSLWTYIRSGILFSYFID